jgi:hypothetical protein
VIQSLKTNSLTPQFNYVIPDKKDEIWITYHTLIWQRINGIQKHLELYKPKSQHDLDKLRTYLQETEIYAFLQLYGTTVVHPNYLENYLELIYYLQIFESAIIKEIAKAKPKVEFQEIIKIAGDPWWVSRF